METKFCQAWEAEVLASKKLSGALFLELLARVPTTVHSENLLVESLL